MLDRVVENIPRTFLWLKASIYQYYDFILARVLYKGSETKRYLTGLGGVGVQSKSSSRCSEISNQRHD